MLKAVDKTPKCDDMQDKFLLAIREAKPVLSYPPRQKFTEYFVILGYSPFYNQFSFGQKRIGKSDRPKLQDDKHEQNQLSHKKRSRKTPKEVLEPLCLLWDMRRQLFANPDPV